MKQIFLCTLGCALLLSCNNPKPADETTTPAIAAETKPQPVEFADSKYADIGKRDLNALSSGDIDKWMEDFADNAMYRWNSGDSLAGKAAISAYWKKRRTEVIDSISYAFDIWLPVKVNEPQQIMQSKGVWLLGWYQVNAKYKTGKRMSQWIHTDYHFDANDKIDQMIQYIDRAPINAATAK